MLRSEFAPSQVQYLTLGLAKLHEVLVGPLLNFVHGIRRFRGDQQKQFRSADRCWVQPHKKSI